MPFRLVDHTADLICLVEAPTLEALFEEAAQALTSLFVDDPSAVRARQTQHFALEAGDPADLLLDWLQALLVAFEVQQTLFARFGVTLEASRLRASAIGEPVDRARHGLAHEVKAITYHGLALRQSAEGWLAEVLVDL